MNWIRLLAVALSGWAFYLTMRYNLHMFQLNGYKRTEQLHWLKKNLRQQWLLPFAFCFGILECIFPCMGLEIAECLILILMIIVYRAFARMHTKKKLVYTARVKRLVATDVVLSPFGFCGNRSRTLMEEACRNGDASGGGTASSAFALQQYQSSHGGRHQSALYQ